MYQYHKIPDSIRHTDVLSFYTVNIENQGKIWFKTVYCEQTTDEGWKQSLQKKCGKDKKKQNDLFARQHKHWVEHQIFTWSNSLSIRPPYIAWVSKVPRASHGTLSGEIFVRPWKQRRCHANVTINIGQQNCIFYRLYCMFIAILPDWYCFLVCFPGEGFLHNARSSGFKHNYAWPWSGT